MGYFFHFSILNWIKNTRLIDCFRSQIFTWNTSCSATDKRTDVCSRPLCSYSGIFSPKKNWFFWDKIFFQNFFWEILTLFYATFQCGRYNVKKIQKKIFFAHEKLKKPPKKVAQNRPRPLFPTNQPRPQPTAQNWFSISWNFGTRHLFSYLWYHAVFWYLQTYFCYERCVVL